MANKKSRSSMQVGGSTILMIFTVLCLTVLAVLSLASAKADVSLTEKAKKSVLAFYEADAKAEEKLKQIDDILEKAKIDAHTEETFGTILMNELGEEYDDEKKEIQFQIPLDTASQALFVKMIPLYQDGASNYKLSQWQIQNTGEYIIDDSLNVWLGE